MDTSNLVGVSPDILADSRVQEALNINQRGIDVEAAKIVTSNPSDRLTKYGIKLRISGLSHKALIARIMHACPSSYKPKRDNMGKVELGDDNKPILESSPDVPGITQALIWLFTLAAPLTTVFSAVSVLETDGLDEFIEIVDKWFSEKNIVGTALQDIISAMAEDMALSAKVQMSSSNSGGSEIKNV